MKSVGKNVENPVLKKVLRETAGIGTEATRASIIETLLRRRFIAREGKKHIVSTPAGRALIDALPETVKDPITTAVWEQTLDDIAQGRAALDSFLHCQVDWLTGLITEVKAMVQKNSDAGWRGMEANVPTVRCPRCGRAMRQRKGRYGDFRGCTGYPACKATLPGVKVGTDKYIDSKSARGPD